MNTSNIQIYFCSRYLVMTEYHSPNVWKTGLTLHTATTDSFDMCRSRDGCTGTRTVEMDCNKNVNTNMFLKKCVGMCVCRCASACIYVCYAFPKYVWECLLQVVDKPLSAEIHSWVCITCKQEKSASFSFICLPIY